MKNLQNAPKEIEFQMNMNLNDSKITHSGVIKTLELQLTQKEEEIVILEERIQQLEIKSENLVKQLNSETQNSKKDKQGAEIRGLQTKILKLRENNSALTSKITQLESVLNNRNEPESNTGFEKVQATFEDNIQKLEFENQTLFEEKRQAEQEVNKFMEQFKLSVRF